MYQYLVLSIVMVPVLGAFLLPWLGRSSEKLRDFTALLLITLPLGITLYLLPAGLSGKIVSSLLFFPLGFNIFFSADLLALFMALVSSLTGAVIVLYSFSYISHYENRNEYYLMVTLFLGSMMGIIFSANLVQLFVFWEITALCSWRLIGFFRGTGEVLRADKAFLVTVFGALVMLVGFIMLYAQAGSFDLPAIKAYFAGKPVPDLIVLLVLFGIFSKSATLPFQTWLPDAGVAPSPVTALLHAAVLVKIGVYVFARLFIATLPLSVLWHTVVPAMAAASAIIAAGAALLENDLKRLIAYSTISQIGFIFLGLSTGNLVGIAGGLLYLLMHGFAKAGLFLCAGIIEQNTRTKDITKMGGLISTMPITATAFIFCAFSVMGIPPFGGFFSKYMVFMGAVKSGQPIVTYSFLFGAFLTIVYLFRTFRLVFLGEARIQATEGSATMLFSVSTLALLSLLGGLFIFFPSHLALSAAAQIMGAVK